jgi:type I site-specific restriction endonuclease
MNAIAAVQQRIPLGVMILEYFSAATHIGLTATPKETKDVSSIHYFGDPVYSYTLKQGIEDGFLAPYKVVRIDIDVDVQGWRPTKGQTDKNGKLIEDRIYNQVIWIVRWCWKSAPNWWRRKLPSFW